MTGNQPPIAESGREVHVASSAGPLSGTLTVPQDAIGCVVFAHGSGSSRHSSRNKQVARALHERRMATLLFDLLTPQEEAVDAHTRHLRFDIPLLAGRLVNVTDWMLVHPVLRELGIAYFGASTGAAAALIAAAELPDVIRAVVSRGGRPDLAGDALQWVRAPTLLVVGSLDTEVIALNQQAMAKLTCVTRLEIVEGATHLFEEPGTLQRVASLACEWFEHHFTTRSPHGRPSHLPRKASS